MQARDAVLSTRGTTLIKDLRRLGYAGCGDVALGPSWGRATGANPNKGVRTGSHRRHSATSCLTNHMVPQYNSHNAGSTWQPWSTSCSPALGRQDVQVEGRD
jgi:hypothetical protein